MTDPVSILGVVSAASTLIGNAVTVVNYLKDFINAKKECVKWLQELDGLVSLLDRLKRRSEAALQSRDPWYDDFLAATRKGGTGSDGVYNEDGSYRPGGLLLRLQVELEALESKLKPKDGWHRFVQRVMYTNDKVDLAATFVKLDRLRSDLSDVMADVRLDLSERTYRKLVVTTDAIIKTQEIQESRARKEEEAKIIKWLSPLEFLERQRHVYSECFYNESVPPGQWLLDSEEFVAWKSGRPWPLYCYGNPGAGKTVISSIIINHLVGHCKEQSTNKQMAVLYLYLNYKETNLQTMPNLISSLLKQLVQTRYFEALPEPIQALYQNSQGEMRPGVNDILKILGSEIATKFVRVYLVVDALDEFPEDDRPKLLTILQSIEPEKVSLLVTSRAFDDIGHELEISCNECGKDGLAFYFHCQTCPDFDLCRNCRNQGVSCRWDHDFEEPHLVVKGIKAPDEEIECFVKWNLDEQRGLGRDRYLDERLDSGHIATTRLGKFCQSSPELIKEIPIAVVSKANGMFLLAKLHMDALKIQSSAAAVMTALKTLSAEVSKIYRNVLERIEDQRKSDVALAKRALSWIVLAHRPLSVSELRQALSIEPSDTEFEPAAQTELSILLTVTAGLISADADRGAVRLVHRTAQEYFESNWKNLFPKAQTDIAVTTLTYLNFKAFSTPCEGNEEDLEVDSRMTKYSFFAYAATYWGNHMQEALDEPDVQVAVMTFLKDPSKLASTIQAAWYVGSKSQTSASWDVRTGVNGLHVCARYGLDFALTTLKEESPDLDIDSRDQKLGQTPLMYACKQGHMLTVSKLLELGADVNVRSTRGSTAIFEAILGKHPKVLEIFLNKDLTSHTLDVNAVHPGSHGRTALMYVALYGFGDALDHLLQRSDVLVNTQDSQGYTALALAATTNYTTIVNKLLGHKDIEINVVNENGATALMIAAEHGKNEIVDELLKHNADPEIKDGYGDSVIFRAIAAGHNSIVKSMLDHGVDIHSLDTSGQNLLHAVCVSMNPQLETVRLLVASGLDIDARGMRKETPLHDACRTGKLDLVQLLLDLHANTSLKDAYDRTPLVIGWQHGNREIVRLLQETDNTQNSTQKEALPSDASLPLWALAKLGNLDLVRTAIGTPGCDLTVTDPDSKNTALHWVILTIDREHLDNLEILQILLDAGHSPNDVNEHDHTPLHLAAYSDNHEATTKLLSSHADIASHDKWGRTALGAALSQNNYLVAVSLLSAGAAQVESMRENEIQATFFAAVQLGNLKMVELLIQWGADVEARSTENQTALQLAKACGAREVLALLRNIIYKPVSEAGEKSPSKTFSGSHSITVSPRKSNSHKALSIL